MDLDFLVHRDDLEKLHQLFMRLGYQRDVWRENVSQYSHPIRPLGSIDVLHAFRPYALEMLTRARTIACLDIGSVHVLEPEDIIGLKVQAIANNPSRRSHEAADIETLMSQYGSQLDWNRIQTYYDLFELGEEARTLRARYGQAHQS